MMVLILIDSKEFVTCSNNTVRMMKICKDSIDNDVEISLIITDIESIENQEYISHMLNAVKYLSTSSKSIDVLIKENLKDRKEGDSLVVLSIDDKKMDVNPNNNSHYIFMDGYITNRVYDLVREYIVSNSKTNKE
jgi:hypothetical protein